MVDETFPACLQCDDSGVRASVPVPKIGRIIDRAFDPLHSKPLKRPSGFGPLAPI